MKSIMLCLFCIIMCGCQPRDAIDPVIKIDQIVVSPQEFEKAFSASALSRAGKAGQTDFLDIFIARKLMLKEAEEMKLDRDPDFLLDIQRFWEQSLLKRLLEKKMSDPAFQPPVSQEELQAYYDQRKDSDFVGKTFEELRDNIHLLLMRQKQQVLVQNWVEKLKKEAHIVINEDLLDAAHLQKEVKP